MNKTFERLPEVGKPVVICRTYYDRRGDGIKVRREVSLCYLKSYESGNAWYGVNDNRWEHNLSQEFEKETESKWFYFPEPELVESITYCR